MTIRGRVQGVGYRAWVERTALRLGIEGYVRNRGDGSVEAVFAGTPEQVTAMISACRRGPSSASVDELTDNVTEASALNQRRPGELFSVLSTL